MASKETNDNKKELSEEDVAKMRKEFLEKNMAGEKGDTPTPGEPTAHERATVVKDAIRRFKEIEGIAVETQSDAILPLFSRSDDLAILINRLEKHLKGMHIYPSWQGEENLALAEANRPYAQLANITERATYYSHRTPFAAFKDHYAPFDASAGFDVDMVEKAIRKLDMELGSVESAVRSEIIYSFSDELLSATFGGDLFPEFFVSINRFDGISENSRFVISELISYYRRLKERITVAEEGYKRLLVSHSHGVVDRLCRIGKNEVTYRKPSWLPSVPPENVREIVTEEYFDILHLTKALFTALPTDFSFAVAEALSIDRIEFVETGANDKMRDSSAKLRNAFIALSQERGSFENFFARLFELNSAFLEDLNHRVRLAHWMVRLYNLLGINIRTALEESREVIMVSGPFRANPFSPY